MNDNSKVAAVVAYITWIGFLVALIIGNRSDRFVTHHLNQALIINILSIIGGVLAALPVLGGILGAIISIATFVFWIMGIYRAAIGSTEPLPFIGDIHLIG